jgi:hypothetical protein
LKILAPNSRSKTTTIRAPEIEMNPDQAAHMGRAFAASQPEVFTFSPADVAAAMRNRELLERVREREESKSLGMDFMDASSMQAASRKRQFTEGFGPSQHMFAVPEEFEEEIIDPYERLYPETVPAPIHSAKYVFVEGDAETPDALIDFIPKAVSFAKPYRASKGFRIDIRYNKKELCFQTPPMCVTFGLSRYQNKKGVPDSLSMDLDYYQASKSEKIEDFFRCMRMLDAYVLENATLNRGTWLAGCKRLPNSDLYTKYNASTRKRENKDKSRLFGARLTLKIQDEANNDIPASALFDKKLNQIEFTEANLPKKCWVVCTFACTGLWLGDKAMSLGFRLKHAQLVDAPVCCSTQPGQVRILPRFASQ